MNEKSKVFLSEIFKNSKNSISYNFIRFGRTRAKALQTVRRLERETSRCSPAPKSNAFALSA
jgi:hypothetical protein